MEVLDSSICFFSLTIFWREYSLQWGWREGGKEEGEAVGRLAGAVSTRVLCATYSHLPQKCTEIAQRGTVIYNLPILGNCIRRIT